MYKNHKGYLITWKNINIDNETLMLCINDLLPVYYCKASTNESKYLYILCHSNYSIDRIQFNFNFAHVEEWEKDAISCRDYIKNKCNLISFKEKGKIPYNDYNYEVV